VLPNKILRAYSDPNSYAVKNVCKWSIFNNLQDDSPQTQ